MNRLRCFLCSLAVFLCMFPLAPAQAHKPSDSYLTVEVDGDAIEGQWDIALRDLDFAIGLDADGNGALTWDEVRSRHAEIAAYALSRLKLTGDGKPCANRVARHLIDVHSDGPYEVLRFRARCDGRVTRLGVAYSLFFDIDPQHRGLVNIMSGSHSATGILGPEHATQEFPVEGQGRLPELIAYLREGVWHIWIGFDHVLFLISLLLPAVLQRQSGKWQPAPGFRTSFVDVLTIVTAFTVAHSITLTLATLGVVSLPSRWVESAIALSVIVSALNNLYPLVRGRRWIAAFAFGLIHGFGFASVLMDLRLPQGVLALALFGFNAGVEVGQLTIVAAFLPLAYMLRASWVYRHVLFVGGSALIALLASVWLVERTFNLRLIPV
jgi:hypothetical protein